MSNLEILLKDYSTKKLKEIVEQQGGSYSPEFIDCSKDELIKRGESFVFDAALEQQIVEMDDAELRNLVENDWENYHLECMEIARREYLKRNFKVERKKVEEQVSEDVADEATVEPPKSKYASAISTSEFLKLYAWLNILFAVIGGIYFFTKGSSISITIGIGIGAEALLATLILLAASESIRVIVDIEENTRMTRALLEESS